MLLVKYKSSIVFTNQVPKKESFLVNTRRTSRYESCRSVKLCKTVINHTHAPKKIMSSFHMGGKRSCNFRTFARRTYRYITGQLELDKGLKSERFIETIAIVIITVYIKLLWCVLLNQKKKNPDFTQTLYYYTCTKLKLECMFLYSIFPALVKFCEMFILLKKLVSS